MPRGVWRIRFSGRRVDPNRIEDSRRRSFRTPVGGLRGSRRAGFTRLVSLLLLFGATRVLALDPRVRITQYAHDTWNQRDGLPSSAILAIAQTPDGYLWIGTPGGLIRFDGVRFTPVPTNPGNPKIREYVTCIAVDAQGRLYVGTRFDGVRKITASGPEVLPLPGLDPLVHSLQFDSAGRLFIGTATALYRLDPGRSPVIVPTRRAFINSLSPAPDGQMWLGLQYGVDLMARDGTIRRIWTQFTPVNGVASDRTGRSWLATDHCLMVRSGGAISAWPPSNGADQQRVSTVRTDRDGNVWYGSLEGLSRIAPGATPDSPPELLRIGEVTALFEDREGSIWIGTSAGLHRLKDVSAVPWGTPEGLPTNTTLGVVADRHGAVYITGTNPSGVTELRDKHVVRFSPLTDGPPYVAHDGSLWVGTTAKVSRVRDGVVHLFGPADGLLRSWVSAIGEDDQGLILAFSSMDGIRRWDGHKTSFYRLRDGTDFEVPYMIVDFYSAPDHTVWGAGFDGLWHLDHGIVTRYTTPAGVEKLRPWYDEHPMGTKCFRTVIAPGMADYVLCSIADAGNGTLWIASPRRGLTRYREGRFSSVTTRDGLDTDQIYSVLADNAGDLWMATPSGILHVSGSEVNRVADRRDARVHCQVFTRDDGLRNDECRVTYHPAAAKASDGTLWFTTRMGVVSIDPAHLRRNNLLPPVHVEKVLVDGIDYAAKHDPRIAPGAQKLEFRFTALSLLVPQRVRFKYQLVGYDRDWIDGSTVRLAQYTRLAPGRYVFRVKATNNEGVWSAVPATFAFTLEPHFYQTYWFMALGVLAAVGAGYGAYQWRVRGLKRREMDLQGRVDERTRALSESNSRLRNEIAERERAEQEVGRVNRELIIASHQAGMAEVATGVLHNVGNALNSVNVSTEVLRGVLNRSKLPRLRDLAELLSAHEADLRTFLTTDPKGRLVPEFLRHISTAAEADHKSMEDEIRDLRKNVAHIREVVAMQQNYARIGSVAEPARIAELVEDALRINAAVLGKTGVKVVRDFDEATPVVTVEKHKVLQILVNFIQNAEYACRASDHPEHMIRIRVAPDPRGVRVDVSDNGIGIENGIREKLFTYGFTTRKDGHGFGLHTGALAVRQMGAEITAESAGRGAGATFSLILPMLPKAS